MNNNSDRRKFLKKGFAAAAASTIPFLAGATPLPADDSIYMIGPVSGYSPQIGTLISMMNYNRQTIINLVKNMKVEQIDFLVDAKANSIGALLMHLAAVEFFYQRNTFDGKQDLSPEEKTFWSAGMELGDQGRKEIKGKEVSYYLDLLEKGRKKTLEEFKKKDDKWLLAIDPLWSKQQNLNTYWKWFHVCEHEANHRGQISFIMSRVPGAPKSGGEG